MKKSIGILLILAIITCLFSGCKADKDPTDPSSVSSLPTESSASVADPEESTAADQETTEAPAEGVTTPAGQGDPAKPTDKETPSVSTDKPDTPTVKPSEPSKTEQNPGSKPSVIAGGKWDGGPVTWQITSDGVLTISGNTYIQPRQNYIWKDYSDIITRVVIEDGITSVPQSAFSYMPKITSVYLGNAVQTIGQEAFSFCTGLKSITISQSVKTIGPFAFAECTALQTISFASGCKLETIRENAFYHTSVREFTAPPSLRKIEGGAFAGCQQLASVTLTGGISTVEGMAFGDCTGLKKLILGESLVFVGGFAFSNCNALTHIENYSSDVSDFMNLPHLTTLVIGGNRTRSGCYSGCPSLTSVTILSPITELSSSAFLNCTSLASLTIPNTVTVIGWSALRHTAITKITIPAGVTEVGVAAFTDSPLSEVVFTGNAPYFVNGIAFTNVHATVYYPANNETWTEQVLQNYGGTLNWVGR